MKRRGGERPDGREGRHGLVGLTASWAAGEMGKEAGGPRGEARPSGEAGRGNTVLVLLG